MKKRASLQAGVGRKVRRLNQANPADDPGYQQSTQHLDDLLDQVDKGEQAHLDGVVEQSAAAVGKRALRSRMKRAHVHHIVRIAREAARELPELAQLFVVPAKIPYNSFRPYAQHILDEARKHGDLLVRYGLNENVVADLEISLAQFDAMAALGVDARAKHVGATASVDAVAAEIFRVVRGMDGYNRIRFAQRPDLLAEWESASSLPREARPVEVAAVAPAGEVKPAA